MQQATLEETLLLATMQGFRYSCPVSAPSSGHAIAMHLHTGHYCELDQETDLAFQSITTKNYLSFPALFLKKKKQDGSSNIGQSTAPKIVVSKMERVGQCTVGTAIETPQWRNT